VEKVERYCNIKTVLKVVYLQHKQNRRVDFLLATLMKIARDKTSERLLMQEKGKHTHRVCEINTRHNENIWKVTLQHQDVFYTVHRLLTSCECKYHAAVAMYVFISTLAPVLMQPFMLLSANTSISFTRGYQVLCSLL